MDCGGEVKCEEEIVVSCGDRNVGELGCLIEKGMGKVTLNGVSSVEENVGDMNRDKDVLEDGNSGDVKSNGGEDNEKSVSMNDGNEKSITSNELVTGEDESSDDSDSGSDTESSSSSSSSGSSIDGDDDDDDEDEEDNSNSRDSEMEEGEILAYCADAYCADDMVACSGDDDDIEESGPKGPIRSKNELKDLPYVPPVMVTIQPDHQTLPVGNISSIIGAQVIVEGVEKHNPLNEGSILWITDIRSPLGMVDEIFGPVKNPYYIVRYNSEDEIPAGIRPGMSISFVQEFANHVLNDKTLYKKGYDASGENDEELSDELEFSDDEKEAEYKRMKNKKKRGTTEQNNRNKKMDKKKAQNRPMDQKKNQASAPQVSASVPNKSQNRVPPFAASGDQGSSNFTTRGQAQGSGNGPAFPQMPQFHGFGAPSTNGIPRQQPQSTGFPSFPMPTQPPGFVPLQQQPRMGFPGVLPATNMQWAPQSHPQPLFQMPLPYQQLNVGPMFPPNFLPGGQPSFGTGPVAFGQGTFNQPSSMNSGQGQQLVAPNVPQGGSNNDLVPPSSTSGTPMHFQGGRQANHRGGGRFRGGRGGRQQNN